MSNGRTPGDPWAIYDFDDGMWPTAPGRVFLPGAVADLADALFGLSRHDIHREMTLTDPAGAGRFSATTAPTRESSGVVLFFRDLIEEGLLTTYARPFVGRGSARLETAFWDHDAVVRSIATGSCSRSSNPHGSHTHWVFVRADEMSVLLELYASSPEEDARMDVAAQDMRMRVEFDRRHETILGLLRGAHDDTLSRDAKDMEEDGLLSLFPDVEFELNDDDTKRFNRLAVAWLRGRFADPALSLSSRIDHRHAALGHFAPLMTVNRFRAIWAEATQGDEYKTQRKPGPKPGARQRQR